MDKLKYGLIGTGGMGQGHLSCLNNIESIDVVAAADPFPESLENCRKNNATTAAEYFTDYKELLALDDVDAVVIATPDYLHCEHVIDALRAGKHVLSEKPAATTAEDLDKIEKEVRKTDRIYQIGLELRFMPSFVKMKQMLEEGTIGRPQMLWCLEFRGPFLKKVGDWIIRQEYTGGAWVEKMCHYLDLVNWFAGSRPKKVSSFSGQDVVTEVEGAPQNVFDNGWTNIEYENSTRATLGMGMFCEQGTDLLEVSALGPKGRLCSNLNTVNLYDGTAKSHTMFDLTPGPDIQKYSHNGGVYFEHLEFMDCIRNNRKPLTDFEVARNSVLVGLAAEESAAKGGAPVKIN